MSDAQKALDEYEARPVQELIYNAQQLVTRLCERGPREWVMSVPVRPDDSDIILSAALTKASERIAELERHNELLRDALASSIDSIEQIMDYVGSDNPLALLALAELVKTDKLQAAIDAGALETNAYREGYTAGTREDANKPEPYPPYDIGTDQANDWLRGFRDAGALEGE